MIYSFSLFFICSHDGSVFRMYPHCVLDSGLVGPLRVEVVLRRPLTGSHFTSRSFTFWLCLSWTVLTRWVHVYDESEKFCCLDHYGNTKLVLTDVCFVTTFLFIVCLWPLTSRDFLQLHLLLVSLSSVINLTDPVPQWRRTDNQFDSIQLYFHCAKYKYRDNETQLASNQKCKKKKCVQNE